MTIFVPLDKEEENALVDCATTPEAKTLLKEAIQLVRDAERAFGGGAPRQPSPYELGQAFVVPVLCVVEEGDLFDFDSTFLLEHPWKLSQKDASLQATYNPLNRPKGKAGILDITEQNRITTGVMEDHEDFVGTLHQQVLELGGTSDWSMELLIAWIDRRIDHADIPSGESAAFIRKAILGLMARHGIDDIGLLVLDRHRLRDQIEARIQQHRESERKHAFRTWLLPESPLVVAGERTIDFSKMSYEPGWLYEGGFQFKKHYFGGKPGELLEKRANGELREEFKCAQYLDGLPEVKFWARNLSKRTSSFRLQTSSDWFYPDFIALLHDGRVLVVEYKGKVWSEIDDSEEKRAVGAVWESRSNGQCLFVMPDGPDLAAIEMKIRPR